ncbi:MAG TPA: Hsp20/alpha crystallin family protein [Acidimicrobiia bacterium]|nr:Hsp20/alpha crystallin family protein [Acidimicrobiia bacterium]
MELKLWSPFFSLEKDMQSLMDRFLGEQRSAKFDWRPTTDMYRENGTLVIKAELPGLDPAKDIEIAVEDDLLTIRGQKTAEQEVTEKDRFMKERMFGTFERRIPLPDGVRADDIAAAYDKGVLTVKVPVPAKEAPVAKRIAVSIS